MFVLYTILHRHIFHQLLIKRVCGNLTCNPLKNIFTLRFGSAPSNPQAVTLIQTAALTRTWLRVICSILSTRYGLERKKKERIIINTMGIEVGMCWSKEALLILRASVHGTESILEIFLNWLIRFHWISHGLQLIVFCREQYSNVGWHFTYSLMLVMLVCLL